MLRRYWQNVLFWCLVMYQRLLWAIAWCWTVWNRTCQYFVTETPEQQERRRKWGKSAPTLDGPVTTPQRPLSTRVVSAFCYYTLPLDNRILMDEGLLIKDYTCIDDAFRNFLDDPEANTLRRADIFHGKMENLRQVLGHNNTELSLSVLVIYKTGLRSHAVVYTADIVFPPSVPTGTVKSRITTAWKGQLEITNIVKQLAGPCEDFYVGSTFETSPYTVLQHLSLIHFDEKDANAPSCHHFTVTCGRRETTLFPHERSCMQHSLPKVVE